MDQNPIIATKTAQLNYKYLSICNEAQILWRWRQPNVYVKIEHSAVALNICFFFFFEDINIKQSWKSLSMLVSEQASLWFMSTYSYAAGFIARPNVICQCRRKRNNSKHRDYADAGPYPCQCSHIRVFNTLHFGLFSYQVNLRRCFRQPYFTGVLFTFTPYNWSIFLKVSTSFFVEMGLFQFSSLRRWHM